ncbi:MAG: DUF6314 family protein [Pseudomonadota bacterium]
MRSLMDFAGEWTIQRVIEDHLGDAGQFQGQARLAPDGEGLVYREEGLLTLANSTVMQAERTYLWRQEKERIAVFFADGRAFHSFCLQATCAADRHHCDPDVYDVVYRFDAWPSWSSIWTVKGPRKDYVMQSDYSR